LIQWSLIERIGNSAYVICVFTNVKECEWTGEKNDSEERKSVLSSTPQ
jgi:hypothetical protein